VIITTNDPLAFLFLARKKNEARIRMKMKYELSPIPLRERHVIAYYLLQEMEQQEWFAVVFLKLWKTEGIVCTQ